MPYLDQGPGWKSWDTSAQAAADMAPKASSLREVVLTAMKRAGQPLTAAAADLAADLRAALDENARLTAENEWLRAEADATYRAGAEVMRTAAKRAAIRLEAHESWPQMEQDGFRTGISQYNAAIRALPIPNREGA